MIQKPKLEWPSKHNVFGVDVSATTYDEAVEVIMHSARQRDSAVVSLHSAHAVVEASQNPELREMVNQFEMVAPDGQPVRWALNWFHRTKLSSNVRGTELMKRLCQAAAEQQVPVYLYGSTQEVLLDLSKNLLEMYPDLIISGCQSPPFRQLTDEEKQQVVSRINRSRAGIVFLGLGCPKQDYFAGEFREQLQAVQLCVGAAFDFIAGRKTTAPRCLQRVGLEWFYRMCCEPKRLVRRYLVTNTQFILKFIAQMIKGSSTSEEIVNTQSDPLTSNSMTENKPHFGKYSPKNKVSQAEVSTTLN